MSAHATDIRTLLVADIEALIAPEGPLAPLPEWTAAFRHMGHALAEAVQLGTLDRGLRQVLSYHVIFHWNRLGLPLGTQSALAWAARSAIFGTGQEHTQERGTSSPHGPQR